MNTLKNNRGVTLVFIALFLFLLLMFLGVAVDIGWTTIVRTQAQRRVDASALAAAATAIPLLPANGTRGTVAQTSADTFAGYNKVVNTSTNPTNTVQAIHYDYATQAFTTTTWTATSAATVANAVKVSNAVPTPLFFSGIRNVFGASETGSTTINVNATAYLGSPGTAKPPLPLGFCSSAINYPTNCNVANGLQAPNTTNNSGFFDPATMGNMSDPLCQALVNGTTAMPDIDIGTNLNLNGGPFPSCLQNIQTKYNTNKDASGKWCVIVPVLDNCSFIGSQPASGFAEFCITQVITTGSLQYVQGFLQCPSTFNGSRGGECFGTYAPPVLVQ